SILKTIPIRSNRFGIEPELTAKFAGRGCRIYEVPISYRGRTYNEGKKITWRDGLKAIFTILYFRLVEDLYPEKYGREIFYSLSNTHRIHQWVAGLIGPWVGQRVLELGAGLGNLTRCLMPRDAYAVAEVDPLCFDFLKNLYSYDRRVTVSRFDVGSQGDDFESLEGRFDTVLCLNLLQSVEDDRLALRNLFRVLQPGGRACLLVPQGPWLYGSLDRHQGYLRRYGRVELKSKLEEAGFQVETQFSFNRVCLPAWALHSRVFRSRRLHRVQLKLFDSTIWMWRRLDWILPWPGLSCVAVGKKPAQPVPIASTSDSGQGGDSTPEAVSRLTASGGPPAERGDE
ncbi:MAG: bifunctional glycosyltransferase/class I SAM-dependent methyltransferase, partial [Acidobacteriota bacterium]